MMSHPEVIERWRHVQHKLFQPVATLRCGLELRSMKARGADLAELELLLSEVDRIAELGHFAEDLLLDAFEAPTEQLVDELLEKAIIANRDLAQEKGVEVSYAPGNLRVMCPAQAFAQATAEYLEFAINHSALDELLRIESGEKEHVCTLSVTGMSRLEPSQVACAFQLFSPGVRGIYPELWNRSLLRMQNLLRSSGGGFTLASRPDVGIETIVSLPLAAKVAVAHV